MNLFTVDVEDWFQAGVMQPYVRRNPSLEEDKRLLETMDEILNLLSILKQRATFFCLGNLLPEYSKLIERIVREGHEVASHGMTHRNLHTLTARELEWELKESKRILEDCTGAVVLGFRAPNFSITDVAIDTLASVGYRYDSSVFPVTGRKNYGKLSDKPMGLRPYFFDNGLEEFPLSVYSWKGLSLPIAGGAYLRHFPFSTMMSMIQTSSESGYYHCYIHPWEIDKNHPSVLGMGMVDRLRHYRNIDVMPQRLNQLFRAISFSSIREVLE